MMASPPFALRTTKIMLVSKPARKDGEASVLVSAVRHETDKAAESAPVILRRLLDIVRVMPDDRIIGITTDDGVCIPSLNTVEEMPRQVGGLCLGHALSLHFFQEVGMGFQGRQLVTWR